ncbi:glycosyltransferase [Algoriphagus persicinus]|uniref:glycosyltransferase n=1 Tax=Algoriphagus persicinus TaxID=3108754 RepID=UPI002B3F4002|nr:glycosyltransferase [Algoriphagus sp. E1-3-M2]MEB2784729.1 glycosyltransferase [Algoriphagus sp. E1-3-M2]
MIRNIIFLIDSLQIGGTEKSLLLHCNYLKNFKPIVFVLFRKPDLLCEYQKSGIEVQCFNLEKSYDFKKMASSIQANVEKQQPVLIQSYLFHSDMTLRYLKTDIPKISGLVSNSYSERRLNLLPFAVRMKIQFLKLWDRYTASRIDLFISNSNEIKNEYCRQIGLDKSKVKVIYRGRSLKAYSGIREEKPNTYFPIFLSVGRLIPSKGLTELILAFSKVFSDYPKSILQIAGDGPERKNLELVIKRLGLEHSIFLFGQRNDIPELLNQADYFVFPTHYEGLPGSLIEAMMARIPIICSDIPENRECVSDEMCLFHERNNVNDLSIQMKKALKIDWNEKTKKAFEYAQSNFDITSIAEQYEEVYSSLIGKVIFK